MQFRGLQRVLVIRRLERVKQVLPTGQAEMAPRAFVQLMQFLRKALGAGYSVFVPIAQD